MLQSDVLDAVIAFYIDSGDFNGLPIYPKDVDQSGIDLIVSLVQRGLMQVVSDEDYLNMHIRPWQSRRSTDDQVSTLRAVASGIAFGACLYPRPLAMRDRPEPPRWADEPYRRRMAEGEGRLELAHFTLDVLENYRNDPRYHFDFADVEVHLGITDEAYLDESEPDRDKIASMRVGFSYNKGAAQSDVIVRRVCTFLCDLGDLTPEHQRRWQTYEVPALDLSPHPLWWGMMMGHWPEAVGPFQKILLEMQAINELFQLAYGRDLFRSVERPREWGWVLRPSTAAWQEFILTTDKLLSDNLDHKALTAAGVSRDDDGGRPVGSLRRLESLLVDGLHARRDLVPRVMTPLHDIRRDRQRPAHALDVPQTDQTVAVRQRDLLLAVTESLYILRRLIATEPACANWEAHELIEGDCYRL